MPQMNKGGKFVFGGSMIRPDGRVQLPTQAVDEYRIASEGKVYLFTGSKMTGGFCVTRQGLLLPSKLGHILTETPLLLHYEVPDGTFVPSRIRVEEKALESQFGKEYADYKRSTYRLFPYIF